MFSLLLRSLAIFSLIMTIILCIHPGKAIAQGKTQKISEKLAKNAEELVKEIEKTKKQVNRTVSKYDKIFSKNTAKDRQKAYKDLNKEIKKTEDLVKQVRKIGENMRKEADKFFAEWSKSITKIKDDELRGLSHANMIENRDHYAKIIESGLKAGSLYDSFLTDLKNQGSYLELDMSDSAIAKLKTNQVETTAKAKEMFQSIDELTKVTQTYIASMK